MAVQSVGGVGGGCSPPGPLSSELVLTGTGGPTRPTSPPRPGRAGLLNVLRLCKYFARFNQIEIRKFAIKRLKTVKILESIFIGKY